MKSRTLGDFARYLESIGELHRVKAEVDPELEVTEIAVRAFAEKVLGVIGVRQRKGWRADELD